MEKQKNITDLSELAQKLHAFLVNKNGAIKGDCLDELFEKPKFPENPKDEAGYRKFWQWDANCYGVESWRHCGLAGVFPFKPKEKIDYVTQLIAAYVELSDAGFARSKNNTYFASKPGSEAKK